MFSAMPFQRFYASVVGMILEGKELAAVDSYSRSSMPHYAAFLGARIIREGSRLNGSNQCNSDGGPQRIIKKSMPWVGCDDQYHALLRLTQDLRRTGVDIHMVTKYHKTPLLEIFRGYANLLFVREMSMDAWCGENVAGAIAPVGAWT